MSLTNTSYLKIQYFGKKQEVSESIGGHLVTITSSEENDFVWTAVYNNGLNLVVHNYRHGLDYQNLDSPDYNEPDGGWEWVKKLYTRTGEKAYQIISQMVIVHILTEEIQIVIQETYYVVYGMIMGIQTI